MAMTIAPSVSPLSTQDIRLGLERIREPIRPYSFVPDIPVPPDAPAKTNFESFFNAAMDMLRDTNTYQLNADQAQQDLATGKTDDVLTVMMTQDRAYTTLNFTVQVTNKIIESYREIMRMQM